MVLNNYEKDFIRMQYLETGASVRKTQGNFLSRYNDSLKPMEIMQIWKCNGFLLPPDREHSNGISGDSFIRTCKKYDGDPRRIKRELNLTTAQFERLAHSHKPVLKNPQGMEKCFVECGRKTSGRKIPRRSPNN
jgi:hypothetical protein